MRLHINRKLEQNLTAMRLKFCSIIKSRKTPSPLSKIQSLAGKGEGWGEGENGMILVLVLSFLAILSLLGATAVIVTTTDIKIGGNYKASVQAFYDADAGVNYAIARIKIDLANGEDIADINPSNDKDYKSPDNFNFTFSAISGSDPYTFTSTGYDSSRNAQAKINVTFSKVIVVDSSTAIYGSDPEVEIKGKAKIDGRDHNIPTNFICSGAGCNGSLKGGDEVPGIYTTEDPDLIGARTSGKNQNVFGDPPVEAGEGNYTGQFWQGFANSLIPMADITFNKGDEIAGKQTLGTRDSPKITVIEGKAKLTGTVHGAGILIVTDEMEVKGNLHFEGLIIILNKIGADSEAELCLADNTTLFGAVVVAGSGDSEIETGGNSQILYSSQALTNISNKLNTKLTNKLTNIKRLSWQTPQ